jgi:hypothetical protein
MKIELYLENLTIKFVFSRKTIMILGISKKPALNSFMSSRKNSPSKFDPLYLLSRDLRDHFVVTKKNKDYSMIVAMVDVKK